MRRVSFLAVALLLLGFSGSASADGPADPAQSGSQGLRPHALFLRLLVELNLSPEQEHQVAGILKRYREEFRALLQQRVEAKQRLVGAIGAETFSEEAIREAARQVTRLYEERAVVVARVLREVRPVLTPHQQEVLRQFQKGLAQAFKERAGDRPSLLDRWIDLHR